MKFKDRIINATLGKFIESRVTEETNKRMTAAINRDKEDENWRRISQVTRTRDLPEIKQDKMIKIIDWLCDRKPQAKRIVDLTRNFIIGDGIKFKAEKPETQEVLDRFWQINDLENKQKIKVEELSKYGEWIAKPFTNDISGMVKIGAVDPEQIDKVERNPENAEDLQVMVMKTVGSKKTKYAIMDVNYKVDDPAGKIEGDEKVMKKTDGEVFFFTVNRGSFGTRGKSDLLAIADWIDIYDRTLFTMAERTPFLLAFLWDIMIKGASPEDMQKRLNELKLHPPKPGSYNIHNDNEEWSAVTPDLKAGNNTETMKLLRTQLTGGSGYPNHWLFGIGEDINKATSQEISEPIYRQLKDRQQTVVSIFSVLFRYQIQTAIDKGTLKGKVADHPFKIIIPDPSKKEAGVIAETFAKLMPAGAIAIMNDVLSKDTVRDIATMLVNQMGIEVKADEEKKKVEAPENQKEIDKAVKDVQEAIKKGNKKKDDKKKHEKKK
jgi:hypothetical protein